MPLAPMAFMKTSRLLFVAGAVVVAATPIGALAAPSTAKLAVVTPPAPPNEEPAVIVPPKLQPAPRSERTRAQRIRERWLISLDGVVNAPSDVGVQAGVELPIRLRLSTGFGFMPVEWLTGFVARATDDPEVRAALQLPSYSGTIWRTKLGVRPFRKLGLYFDAGYARATLHGSLDLTNSFLAEEEDLQGRYDLQSSLDLWLLELGYQWRVANHGVLALGLGVMSTFNADTSITASGGAPERSEFVSGVQRMNDALETHGTVPFVTLRFGIDLL
jgi:hypothetical protein